MNTSATVQQQTKATYVPSDKAKEQYQAYVTVKRIIGAGYGNSIFKTDARFIGLTMEQAVCKVLDNPEMLVQFEQEHLSYTVANSSANTLFKLYKEGKNVDASKYGHEIEQLFNEKVQNYLAKNAS